MFGRCYCQVAGVIATIDDRSCFGKCYCQGGWWNAHHGCGLADVVAKDADGMATGSIF